MELKFIWIKEYGILNKIGINFNHSDEHSFAYENHQLTLLPNNKSILDFGSKIRGVTAIAGENGSGKTSLCQIVLATTATYQGSSFGYEIEFDGLVCYGDHIFYHQSIEIENKDQLIAANYNLIEFNGSPFEKMDFAWRDTFAKGGFIYYSNVLDRKSSIEANNLLNISTQNYLITEYRSSTYYSDDLFRRDDNDRRHRAEDIKNSVDIYFLGEAYRFIKFYLKSPVSLPFEGPKNIVLKSAYSNNNRFLDMSVFDFELRMPFIRLEREIFNTIYDGTLPINHETKAKIEADKIKSVVSYLYRLNIIVCISIEAKILPELSALRNFIFEKGSAQEIFTFDSFESIYEKIDELAKIHDEIVVRSNTYEDGMEYSPYHVKNRNNHNEWRFTLAEDIYLPNNDENISLLKQFFYLEESILHTGDHSIKRITNYSFYPAPSAGQLSYLSFFSRLYHNIESYNKGYYDKEKLIIFVDEAEVGYHPAWKKKFLSWLLTFLNSLEFKFSYQLIITTHSPYLLSDLTPSNIILFKRNFQGKTSLVNSEEISTFGANIYDLLSNSFFLSDGAIGEFAKEKIQWVIDKLNAWSIENVHRSKGHFVYREEDKVTVLNIISAIADNIVRGKLFEMYWSVFEESEAVNEEIFFLENRIAKLKELGK